MGLSWKEKPIAAAAVPWLLVFGVLLRRIVHTTLTLRQTSEEADLLARSIQLQSEDLIHLTREIKTQSREIDFLQGMVNVLPPEKGFVRTQRAIAGEVESLRAKVG